MSSPEIVPTRPNAISEFFVDADEAARFLKINRRTLLQWARDRAVPAHPLGKGARKTWRFLISELADWLRGRGNSDRDADR
jgi:excisionase family DNA binding protein